MDSFDKLKQVWQQQAIPANIPDINELKKSNADNQRKLERVQLLGAISLLLTSVAIIWIGFFSSIHFRSSLTYAAVALIALISATQGIVGLTIYARLRRINISVSVAQNLAQWQRYYTFRKQLIRVNFPLYYVLLNGAFGLYFIEILGMMPLIQRLVCLILYCAWMLYAYFILGKRTLKKEDDRLQAIISNLKTFEQQVQKSD